MRAILHVVKRIFFFFSDALARQKVQITLFSRKKMTFRKEQTSCPFCGESHSSCSEKEQFFCSFLMQLARQKVQIICSFLEWKISLTFRKEPKSCSFCDESHTSCSPKEQFFLFPESYNEGKPSLVMGLGKSSISWLRKSWTVLVSLCSCRLPPWYHRHANLAMNVDMANLCKLGKILLWEENFFNSTKFLFYASKGSICGHVRMPSYWKHMLDFDCVLGGKHVEQSQDSEILVLANTWVAIQYNFFWCREHLQGVGPGNPWGHSQSDLHHGPSLAHPKNRNGHHHVTALQAYFYPLSLCARLFPGCSATPDGHNMPHQSMISEGLDFASSRRRGLECSHLLWWQANCRICVHWFCGSAVLLPALSLDFHLFPVWFWLHVLCRMITHLSWEIQNQC